MTQITAATFEDGVFIPDVPPNLAQRTRVRLLVEPLDDEDERRKQAWEALEQLWRTSTFNSQGDRLSREQLHERH